MAAKKKAPAKKKAATKAVKKPTTTEKVVKAAKSLLGKEEAKPVKKKRITKDERVVMLEEAINGDSFATIAKSRGLTDEAAKKAVDVILKKLAARYDNYDWSITSLRKNKAKEIAQIKRIVVVYPEMLG